jgi:hypothetical protein
MALTTVSFTANLSDAIAFSGTVKIKCDGIPEGGAVELLEERVDAAYEGTGEAWSVINWPKKSRLFELLGNYKIKRSHDSIVVGYETM